MNKENRRDLNRRYRNTSVAFFRSILAYFLRKVVKNSDVTDLTINIAETKNAYVLNVLSNVLVSRDRKIIRKEGRGELYIAIVFLISLLIMVFLAVTGMLDSDPIGGRSLVSLSLYPAFVVNLLGARYVIKGLTQTG